jgi:hypothetical protein
MRSRAALFCATFAGLLTWAGGAGPAAAAGRWYAWLDRVPAARGEAVAAEWRRRGVPATLLASERIFGVEPGFAYLSAFDSLFQAEAQAYVDRLAGGGFRGTGVQYFSEALPPGVVEVLGGEPVFAVDAEVDGVAPAEIVALTRSEGGDALQVIVRHADGTQSLAATHPVRLFDLPRTTEGERARVFPLGGESAGLAVVFEAAFVTPQQAAHWSIAFTFTRSDRRAPPGVHFVPGALRPVPTRVTWGPDATGAFGYEVAVDGLRGGPQRRRFVWRQDRFVDGRAAVPASAPR